MCEKINWLRTLWVYWGYSWAQPKSGFFQACEQDIPGEMPEIWPEEAFKDCSKKDT